MDIRMRSVLVICLLTALGGCFPDSPVPLPITPTPTPTGTSLPSPPTVITELYKIEFGPGTKGPGNFGPGTKGPDNLHFNVNFPENVLRPELPGFTIQQMDFQLAAMKLQLSQNGQLVAMVTVLPKARKITFATGLSPGVYDVLAQAEGNFETVSIAGGIVEIPDQGTAEVRAELYAKALTPEAIDIAVLTRKVVNN